MALKVAIRSVSYTHLDVYKRQVEDWASCGDDLSNIEEMIKTHYFIVAVNQLSQIVGFSSITPQGYLHLSLIHILPPFY